MKTLFTQGFQPASFTPAQRRPLRTSLGQALSLADRDHYLVALNRGITEAVEIDAWLAANPNVKLKPSEQEVTSSPDIVISPYFAKWVNYQPVRADQGAFRDRLANADPTTWSSITDAEHILFGWVSVIDQVYSAFKADPKNLTAGRWVSGVRQPDPPPATGTTGGPAKPVEQPLMILGLELPPTFLGMPTQTALIVGGLGVVGIGVAIWATLKKSA